MDPGFTADLLVVGGGPAGLATAIFAAKRGLRVTLLERGVLPIDKPCGEGLMPEGVRLLGEMGLQLPCAHAFHGIRYLDAWAGAVEARFPKGFGLGVRRRELSRAMVERALDLGVRFRERSHVRGIRHEVGAIVVELEGASLRARYLAAADGLHSRIRQLSGLDVPSRLSRARRYGFRRHYHVRPWSHFVEVYWATGAEAYVTPVGDHEVGVAFLWRDRAPSYDAMLTRFPALAARLEGAPVTTSLKGAGPFRRRARRVHQGRLALVGDAAGYLDAITGEGIALGFRSAFALVAALDSVRGLADYEDAYRRLTRRYNVMTELALVLAGHPKLRRRVIRTLSRRPHIFSRLVAASTGTRLE